MADERITHPLFELATAAAQDPATKDQTLPVVVRIRAYVKPLDPAVPQADRDAALAAAYDAVPGQLRRSRRRSSGSPRRATSRRSAGAATPRTCRTSTPT